MCFTAFLCLYQRAVSSELYLQFTSHVLWECRVEGFTLPIPLLLRRSLLSAFFLADVKEFMSASVQMLNLNAFPNFAPIALHLTTNFDRIRRGLPPLPPLPSSELSETQVRDLCLFS